MKTIKDLMKKVTKHNLTVGELREMLSKFPDDMAVEISDPVMLMYYNTKNIKITAWKEDELTPTIAEIDVGGCEKQD